MAGIFQDWSTPERRQGDARLPLIPNEIYNKIFIYFEPESRRHPAPAKELMSLALVCRYFHFVTLPMRFGAIHIRPTFTYDQLIWENAYTNFFCSICSADPLGLWLAGHVQELSIDSCLYPVVPNVELRPLLTLTSLYAGALPKLRNVQTFRLRCLPISKQFIGKMAHLSCLDLRDCNFERTMTGADLRALASRVALKSLSLFFPYLLHGDHIEPLPSGVSMLDLIPLASNLVELRTNSWEFVHCLVSAAVVPPLEVLEIVSVPDLRELHQLICRTGATLVDLTLSRVRWPEHLVLDPRSFSQVKYTLPPNLRRLTCPSHLSYLFTGHHSLEKITFAGTMEEATYDFLEEEDFELSGNVTLLMQQRNQSLRTLEFLPYAFVMDRSSPELENWNSNMMHWFPNLEQLDIFITTGDEHEIEELQNVFKSFIKTWGRQDTLRFLRFSCLWEDDASELVRADPWFQNSIRELKVLESYFPNLVFVSFAKVILFSKNLV
ncbi:hypothetical protein BT96DRAFT_1007243 [Gymnopus androsaceus JB14]|uniref:F-box domain-containing protein n=1 Tax=Gymnopus androsaceus JB14 TaxID=1447944 RepID=A0A6A4GIM5_9AGAR|nr:hypothetical protein BT96DRAFT_1007243 [Gymnopus androsaceus JB14]